MSTMRKLIVSMNVTLDGFMAGPNCELDWHFRYWNDDMANYAGEELSKADTILLGRVTYSAMARYWPGKARDFWCPRQDIAFADMMNNYRKIVFSRTLAATEWGNSVIVSEDLADAIERLKQQPGKDIMIYGSGKMVRSLLPLSVIDEFQLWIHPVAIGAGKPLFRDENDISKLLLQRTKTFDSGVVVLHYVSLPGDKNKVMEKHVIKKDIKVFCVTASSFPDGVMAAHQQLHAVLPSVAGRKFFGISRPNAKGVIVYKAAVEESKAGEAKKYGLESFTIPKGEYISELLAGWRKDETIIGNTFQKLLADPRIDQNGFCLEEYLAEDEMRCMVRINSPV